MKKICIITSRYPTDVDKTALAFVQQFAWAMADNGIDVTVICPLPVNINRKFAKVPEHLQEKTYKNNTVTTYFPKFIGFGQRDIKLFNTARLTTVTFKKAVKNIIKKYNLITDVFYGHFMAPAGIVACEMGKAYNKPAFIAYGESSTWAIDHMGKNRVKRRIENVKGVISVSTNNKNDLLRLNLVSEDLIEVFPNGYIPERFHHVDKQLSREYFGFSQEDFIVCFVGHFIKRKGLDVLLNALKEMNDVKLICGGKGPINPNIANCIYANLVDPDELSMFYSSADVFVLPTQNEGCCNALIEAMACGLPIISSDMPFNYDVLSDENSILVDPNSKEQIKEAINKLKNNESIKKQKSENSLKKASLLTLQKRSENIIDFINRKI